MKKNKGFTLIEILVVMGIIAILAAIVLIAINPARQFAQARNTQRTSNVNSILNAVGQYIADNKGELPSGITTTKRDISDAAADICDDLVPTYLPALPVDPEAGEPVEASDCDDYNTEYKIQKDSDERVTVCAPNAVEPAIDGSAEICVTR